MEKTDADLKAAISRNEVIAMLGGGLVVLSLIAESVWGVVDQAHFPNLARTMSTVPNGAIALGVTIEILFARLGSLAAAELQRQSELRIAELQREVAEAELMAVDAALGGDNPRLRARIQEKMRTHISQNPPVTPGQSN